MLALGCLLVWTRSEVVGAEPIAAPLYGDFTGRVVSVEAQPALSRQRLVVVMRAPGTTRAIKVRLNLPVPTAREEAGYGGIATRVPAGSVIHFRARLMPPAPAPLPGAYDFARAAWFSGLSASGTILGPVRIVDAGKGAGGTKVWREALAAHVLAQVDGPAGGIAAALVSGERGAIGAQDAQAMRDSGLAHLLAISGLHVSAVIGLVYFLAIRLLALWPALALRVRLPVLASALGALAGLAYTLMTGAQVPTIRSCVAALLVLLALALGRQALSLRMLGVGAFVVLGLWPEAIMGPSFQMSFAAVLALVTLSNSPILARFVAPRDESWLIRILRWFAMLMLSGIVIELALLPISLFHFHRAGVYGSFANLLAIPVTTFLIMPGLVLALAADLVGLGAPFWWGVAWSVRLVLGVAHWVAVQPGAVTALPRMGGGAFLLFVLGGLWGALWTGRLRLLGLLPLALGVIGLLRLEAPDLLISGDGRNTAVISRDEGGRRLYLLRESRSDYVRDNFRELAGLDGEIGSISELPQAQCGADFCVVTLHRDGRAWRVLVSRSRDAVPERALAAACDQADIVISERWLPHSCRPRWLKADRRFLARTGGLAIDLGAGRIDSVAAGQGEHGWWRPAVARHPARAKDPRPRGSAPSPAPALQPITADADQIARRPDSGS